MISTKLIKYSPLMAILAAAAICITMVGAVVMLTGTSNSVTTAVSDGSGVIGVSITGGTQSTSQAYVGQSNGVTYGLTVNSPDALVSGATITVTFTDNSGPIGSYSNIAPTLVWAGVHYAMTGSAYTTYTLSYSYTVGSIGSGVISGQSLEVVYNEAGTFVVTASVSGAPSN